MQNNSPPAVNNNIRWWYPSAALVFVIACLTLEHLNGGVQSHHLLNNPDLPAISNWFGLVTLPILAALFAQRVTQQVKQRPLFIVFGSAVLYGALMAITFTYDASDITGALFIGLIALSIVLPVFRVEYIFGFVVGMSYTFGGVLPLIVASVLGFVSFVVRSTFLTIKKRLNSRSS